MINLHRTQSPFELGRLSTLLVSCLIHFRVPKRKERHANPLAYYPYEPRQKPGFMVSCGVSKA